MLNRIVSIFCDNQDHSYTYLEIELPVVNYVALDDGIDRFPKLEV